MYKLGVSEIVSIGKHFLDPIDNKTLQNPVDNNKKFDVQ